MKRSHNLFVSEKNLTRKFESLYTYNKKIRKLKKKTS